MPILKINILGSKIEINYQKDEKEKLIRLIEQFKLRLSELENLKGRFSDNKIIFLAALKVEDDIFELKKTLNNQKKMINSLDEHKGKINALPYYNNNFRDLASISIGQSILVTNLQMALAYASIANGGYLSVSDKEGNYTNIEEAVGKGV